ncbi:hypothetical protein [Nocardia mangyaensis]|uniref:hypothetical protein n=1 Tax=Nocardia mangyaensis TaxID=2213200 RepID=UPI002675BB9F|nr:hypothetical protein [Nocardia mangyaensis]MDO3651347.1 hypothetical protein [Nocardia mangyaensis]
MKKKPNVSTVNFKITVELSASNGLPFMLLARDRGITSRELAAVVLADYVERELHLASLHRGVEQP